MLEELTSNEVTVTKGSVPRTHYKEWIHNIVVFSNWIPNCEELADDRWNIIHILPEGKYEITSVDDAKVMRKNWIKSKEDSKTEE